MEAFSVIEGWGVIFATFGRSRFNGCGTGSDTCTGGGSDTSSVSSPFNNDAVLSKSATKGRVRALDASASDGTVGAGCVVVGYVTTFVGGGTGTAGKVVGIVGETGE